MNSIKVLDVTLRDGGCVIDFNFGQPYMDQILAGLELSGIDIIEIGYLDSQKGTVCERTQFCNEQVVQQYFLKEKKPGITYVAMFDYGKFDPDLLQPCNGTGIDGLRLAFHKKDCFNMIPLAKKVVEKGYQLYLQPMAIMRYSDREILELIEVVNSELPFATAFYIVDSFGEMRMDDLNRIAHLVDHNLCAQMTMGFHSHNNLQLSYSNAVALLQLFSDRDLIIDSAILGMGKGAGNLNTELFLEHLNLYYNKNYRIYPLLEVIDSALSTIRAEHYWGYSIEYYLSSVNHCTSSYASHFYRKHMLPVERVAELLSLIAEEKKISFDKEYAEQLYLSYNASHHQDDDPVIQKLTEVIRGKKVLLIAPGRRLIEGKKVLEAILMEPEVVSVSLNNYDLFDTDYVFTSRADAFQKAYKDGKHIIATSGICGKHINDVLVIDYQKWITVENGVQDSSGIVALKLMAACGASEIFLAGFDGFSVDINLNYHDKTMRHPFNEEEVKQRNNYFRAYVRRLRSSIPVTFLTESLYEG